MKWKNTFLYFPPCTHLFTALQLSYLILSFFNDKRLLASKYSEYFIWSALPLLYSWSDSPIGCSAPLYSWSGSLIGSAYYFLYISFCFRFNKALTNLTSLRQHHLQYKWTNFFECSFITAGATEKVHKFHNIKWDNLLKHVTISNCFWNFNSKTAVSNKK